MPDILLNNAGLLLVGARKTVYLAASAAVIATGVGLLLTVLRLSGIRVLGLLARLYLLVIRGIPLLVLLFAMYYVLPYSGYEIDTFSGAAIVIGLYFGAFMSEVFRAAVASVPRGQWDAGRALGMHGWSLGTIVVVPQALRLAAAPFINTCVMLVKGTAVVSIIGISELTMVGRQVAERTLAPFQVLFGVAAIYFVLCYGLSLVGRAVEARTADAV